MRHTFTSLVFAAVLLLGGSASAAYTVDLIWADSGTPTLTITPGDAATTGPAGTACGKQLSGASGGRCLTVVLTASLPVTASIVTLGWNAANSGLAHDWTGFRSIGQFAGSGFPGAAGPTPANALTTDCAGSGCDTAWGSFGGLSAAPILAGVYLMGSINFDTSGALVGSHDILNFLRTGVDGTTNKKFEPSPVQLNGATLNVIPEPGTAALLGLGIMGLVMAGRRRKA